MSGEVETCSETMWDGWNSRACRRPVKRDGMCGIHAAAKERRAKNSAARAEKRAEERAREQRKVERQLELLAAEAAVARVRLLADEWATITGGNTAAVETWHAAAECLTAALAAQPTTTEAS